MSTKTMLITLVIVTTALMFAVCGDEGQNPCEKARGIQKRICVESNSENCFPCPCIIRGEDYEISTNNLGVPDLSRSVCINPEPCEGIRLGIAENCIDDENTCDPRYYQGSLLFDNGEPIVPGICGVNW